MNDPKPGSEEAYEAGCKCPILDNHHGEGRYGDGAKYGWFVGSKCPLHRVPALDALLEAVDGVK